MLVITLGVLSITLFGKQIVLGGALPMMKMSVNMFLR
jgi:hypothetical protein